MNSNHEPIVCLHTTIQMEMIETEVQFQTVCENEEHGIAQRTLSAHEFRLYHGVVGYTSNFYSIPFMVGCGPDKCALFAHSLRSGLCYLR